MFIVLFSSFIQTITVGFGVAPNQSFLRESRTIPPVGNRALPWRKLGYKIRITFAKCSFYRIFILWKKCRRWLAAHYNDTV